MMGLPYSIKNSLEKNDFIMKYVLWRKQCSGGMWESRTRSQKFVERHQRAWPCWRGIVSTGGCWGSSWKNLYVRSFQAWPRRDAALEGLSQAFCSISSLQNEGQGVGWALQADYNQTQFWLLTPWLLPSPTPKAVWLSSLCHLGL